MNETFSIDLEKGGPYIGPRGGKWADPKHTIPWKGPGSGKHVSGKDLEPSRPTSYKPYIGDRYGEKESLASGTEVENSSGKYKIVKRTGLRYYSAESVSDGRKTTLKIGEFKPVGGGSNKGLTVLKDKAVSLDKDGDLLKDYLSDESAKTLSKDKAINGLKEKYLAVYTNKGSSDKEFYQASNAYNEAWNDKAEELIKDHINKESLKVREEHSDYGNKLMLHGPKGANTKLRDSIKDNIRVKHLTQNIASAKKEFGDTHYRTRSAELQLSTVKRNIAENVYNRLVKKSITEKTNMEKAVYTGPRGGKYKDPQHKIPVGKDDGKGGVKSKKDMYDLLDVQEKIREIHPLLNTIIGESNVKVKKTYEELAKDKIKHSDAMHIIHGEYEKVYKTNAKDLASIKNLRNEIKSIKDKRREVFSDKSISIAEVSDYPEVKSKAEKYSNLDQFFREGKDVKVKDLLQASRDYYSSFNSAVSSPIDSKDKSLTDVLKEAGVTHESVGGSAGKRRIKQGGKTIFTGNSQETWDWLRSTNRIKKSLGANNMNNDAINELNDFVKSTIEDSSQPTIGESKKNGEGQSLAGKSKPSGTNPSGDGTPKAPKVIVTKLSEDDAVDEANMKPHTKPIERGTRQARKSLPVANQREQMAYELAKAERQANRDVSVTPVIDKVLVKAEAPKQLSSDEQAAAIVEGGTFYKGGDPKMNWGSPLTSSRACRHCEGSFMKALTTCPHCGTDNR